jgi:hypothetical protein
MGLKDDFLLLFRAERAAWLENHDRGFVRALMDDDAASQTAMKLRRRYLLDLPASINGQTRPQLIALWPIEFSPLPLRFVNPAQALALDPPGLPCIVNLSSEPPLIEE